MKPDIYDSRVLIYRKRGCWHHFGLR